MMEILQMEMVVILIAIQKKDILVLTTQILLVCVQRFAVMEEDLAQFVFNLLLLPVYSAMMITL
jgi:hypothetical protein